MVLNVDDNIMNDDHKAFYSEDFIVNSKTVLTEYERTNNTGIALCGSYSDEYIGDIAANTVFKISPNINFADVKNLGFTNKAVFDSITLIMKHNGYIYGDSTSSINLAVHKLTSNYELDTIRTVTSEGSIYTYNKKNNSTTPYDPTPLATFSFTPEKLNRSNDSIYVTLPYELGLEWFNKIVALDPDFVIKSTASTIDSDEKFIDKVLNGITIRNVGLNKAIVGFNMPTSTTSDEELDSKRAITIRLHYHKTGPFTKMYYDFDIYQPAYQYNQITADYSKGMLDGIVAGGDGISSKLTNNLTFVHSGLGLITEVEIPSLHELYNLGNKTSIIDADLVFSAIPRSFASNYPLPKYLAVELLKRNGQLNSNGFTIINGDEKYTYAVKNTNLTKTESDYMLPITYYAWKEQKLISSSSAEHETILITAQSKTSGNKYPANMDRIILGSSDNHKSKMKMEMYYTTFEE